ncbi:crotonase/enoyl-CoA hydratase family protein [Bosea psychrotolerans]|uniref:Enoyl-CoA hydratase/carnithine racemase n=1 Tax=Bosea psychrotolerans TaxID=1871628 RepID=A0A2S4MD06_9HYPH|nr:crotonase/enoyl-CoA hydratase family protein [Bosea psychrotolerans]POR52643.1 enoyl-CoA hydratase/carnithine racemase [Bosea psychrotolerans]
MTSTTEQPVLIDMAGSIATLTLNRPAKLNALNYATIDALQRHLDAIERDEAVRIVILTGAGEKAFSAGADIAGFSLSVEAGVTTAMREFVGRGQALTRRIENFPKPVIAAVNGLAFGGGCEIVEACPLAIASEHARFAKPEINLGFPPTFGGTQRLPRHVGRKRALQLILTGDPISAEDAVQIGLINEIVPASRLLTRTRQLAATILGKSAAAVSACLASVTRGINLSIDEGLAVEASQFAQLAHSSDVREGISAFLERRPAHFSGR